MARDKSLQLQLQLPKKRNKNTERAVQKATEYSIRAIGDSSQALARERGQHDDAKEAHATRGYPSLRPRASLRLYIPDYLDEPQLRFVPGQYHSSPTASFMADD